MFKSAFVPSHSFLALFTFLTGLVLPVAAVAEARVSEAYGRLPLHFEANRGQTRQDVCFLARGPGYSLYLTAGEAVLVLARPNPDAKRDLRSTPERLNTQARATPVVVRMSLVGAAPKPLVSGLEELPGKANYFIGNDPAKWRTNVPTYAKVHYQDVYPGIDLVYYGNQRQLEYDFVVAPGGDPERIALGFQGVERLEIDAEGELVLHAAGGALRQRKPVIYQETDGLRREIDGGYILKGANRVGFRVAAYDDSRPLVIDPVLFYSTYLGGSGFEVGNGIAVDPVGNAYVTGTTASVNFPTTAGAFDMTLDMTLEGNSEAFVTKLNPTGSALLYSTYLGGSSGEEGFGIAVDIAGNAYVTGETGSPDFPTTLGAFQTAPGFGGNDAFITKLNPTGTVLIYSSYLGGSNSDEGFGVVVDALGNAYVTGTTTSTNFPTSNAFQIAFAGGTRDAFVTKINPAGTGLVYSTYLGGSNSDEGFGIVVDALGNAYVTGTTTSTNFPTSNAFQIAFAGGTRDAFVTKINPAGTGPVYSTYLGGGGDDSGHSIAVDATGNAYLSGATGSINFPTTPGAFQMTFQGGDGSFLPPFGFLPPLDAFATKLNATGSALVYSTYLGGSSDEAGLGIAVDAGGNAYVTGLTDSTNFPTLNAIQSTFAGGDRDAFVTKINPMGTGLVYSTYLGGTGDDVGFGIALDGLPSPNAYVTGVTASVNFPTTPGAFQTSNAGSYDAFVAKIVDVVLPPPPTVGKVTGGGSIDVPDGIGTFGFIVQRKTMDSAAQGQLQYVNHATKAKVHSEMFTTFVITGNMATFGGTCTSNGVPCTFNVDVEDSGEPGENDKLTITVNVGPPEGGTLRSGNIQVHE
jgi:beta-propeller repeat-containing protein